MGEIIPKNNTSSQQKKGRGASILQVEIVHKIMFQEGG